MQSDEYRKLAAVEDAIWYFHGLHAQMRARLEKVIRPAASPARVLDAGCGTGGLIRRLSGQMPGVQWTGLDLSPLACELARERVKATVVEGSVTALPFADGTFDAVVSADVLYHLDDDDAALREFYRVLKPGGAVVINVPAFQWLWSYHDVAVSGRRRYARLDLLRKLKSAQFIESRATYWNTLAFPLIVARRKCWPAPKGGSDVDLFPPPIETFFRGCMRFEVAWTTRVSRLPFGSSVLATARRPT